jgi:hypothetical protein
VRLEDVPAGVHPPVVKVEALFEIGIDKLGNKLLDSPNF